MKRSHVITISVTALLVTAWAIAAWQWNGAGNPSKWSPTGGVSNDASQSYEIQKPDFTIERYLGALKTFNTDIVNSESFQACTAKGFSTCAKTHAWASWSTLEGKNLETQLQGILAHKANENFNVCADDILRSCNEAGMQELMAKKPDTALCDKYEEPLRRNCVEEAIRKMAIVQDSVAVCDKLTEPLVKEYCTDTYNEHKAVKENDAEWCKRLSKDYLQENCKRSLPRNVAIDRKDPSYCTKAGSGSTIECLENYVNMALVPKEPKDCQKIDELKSLMNDDKRLAMANDRCIDRFYGMAFAKYNTNTGSLDAKRSAQELCDAFKTTERKELCQKELSKK